MKKKRVMLGPNEGYALPKSSDRGQPFIDWNEVLRESIGVQPKLKVVRKRRKKYEV